MAGSDHVCVTLMTPSFLSKVSRAPRTLSATSGTLAVSADTFSQLDANYLLQTVAKMPSINPLPMKARAQGRATGTAVSFSDTAQTAWPARGRLFNSDV